MRKDEDPFSIEGNGGNPPFLSPSMLFIQDWRANAVDNMLNHMQNMFGMFKHTELNIIAIIHSIIAFYECSCMGCDMETKTTQLLG